ncbi:MAG: ATP-binding protein, partial [Sulfurimicrobium sp.]|nr:ATP-binding protein [Sulfurimicrobium sp.]
RKKENVFKPNVKGEKLPELLKVAAIYGPNASGKSNLMKAFELIRTISTREPSAQNKPLPVAPFRFDPSLVNQPSRIEVHFIYQGQRYEFNLAATTERIVEEQLFSFPKGKETLLYERFHTPSGETYTFGDSLEGGREVHEAWRKLTGPQSLFISQAVANSSDELQQLRQPLRWLQHGIVVVEADMNLWAKASQRVAKDHPTIAEEIVTFLQEIDVPVTGMRFEPIGGDTEEKEAIKESAETPRKIESIKPEKGIKTTLTHKSALGEAKFEFDEESRGTQNLFGFWLPWRLKGAAPDELLGTLAVDELDSSLHPKIVASLVAKHLKLEQPAQLIFTTHDTHLMDTGLMRRDQFWITERDMNGATQLRSIHDFEGRESEDIEKRYYEGRYRGLPLLRRN